MRRHIYPLLLTGIAVVLLLAAQYLQYGSSGNGATEIALMPELLPIPGFYQHRVRIRMQPSHPQGKIIFTTDGSVPTPDHGQLYQRPIILEDAYAKITTIRAIEVVGVNTSPILTASYAVGFDDGLPIVALTAEPAELWDADIGILSNDDRRGNEWERPVEFALLDSYTSSPSSQPAGIRIIGDPLLQQNKHNFRLYFRAEYGNARLDYNPLRPPDRQRIRATNMYKRLLLQTPREGQAIDIIKEHVVSEILTSIGMPAAESRIVHLIINDNSWGLYRLTERIDNVFLADSLNIVSADIVQEGNAREGTDNSWNDLLSLVNEIDLAADTQLNVIDAKVNLQNLMTTSCIQRYFQLPADAFYAVYPPGGKWFWIFEGGGTQPFQTSDFNIILSALMRNASFRLRYATACSDLLNTVLSQASMIESFTQHSDYLSKYYYLEQMRWPETPPWELVSAQQLDALSGNESKVRQEIGIELGYNSIASIDFLTTPTNGGFIYINGRKSEINQAEGVSTNSYYHTTNINIQAVAQPGYTFSHWHFIKPDGTTTTLGTKSVTHTVGTAFTVTAQFQPESQSSTGLTPDIVHINEYWINDNGTRYASVDYRPIRGDWIELLVDSPGKVDMRGWRITDNNTITSTQEGSLILPTIEALASVPNGTVILLLTSRNTSNDENYPVDDLSINDRKLILYIGNGNLDNTTDPGFDINPRNDNIALLSPGRFSDFTDDSVIDFIAEGPSVTAFSFGALEDDVTFDRSFTGLGSDDGAILATRGRNDRLSDWIVDPDNCQSGDALCANARNIVTPGWINPAQSKLW